MPAASDNDQAPKVPLLTKEQLKSWLAQTDRKYLVLYAPDLVEALTFPDGVEVLQQMLAAYRDLRRTRETGLVSPVPVKGGGQVWPPVTRTEFLEGVEAVEAIEQIQRQVGALNEQRAKAGAIPPQSVKR